MTGLDRLLSRRVVRRGLRYFPFSEPPYRGRYPFSAARGTPATTNYSSLFLATSKKGLLRPRSLPLNLYEDRRFYHPLGDNAFPVSIKQTWPQIVERAPRAEIWSPKTGELLYTNKAYKSNTFSDLRFGFEHPWKMVICLKRKIRREIMHAMGYAGKTGFKKPRYHQFSYVRCF